MITYALTITQSRAAAWTLLVAGLLILSMQALAEDALDEKRVSITTQSSRADRDAGLPGTITTDEFAAFRTAGGRATDKAGAMSSKSGDTVSMTANTDFWFYTADVELFNDHDRDGFYHGIDLYFDADTYYSLAEVYAVVYLSLDGGPWNEYAATENFSLFGASSEDDYVIVTELLSGYPSGSYDLLIELFDAYDDSFLASYGPEDTPELAFLPLEDANRDIADTTDVVVVNHHHGGGSTAMLFILFLGLAAAVKFHAARCA